MSTSHLCPCPACHRHVMTDARVCPFCEAALPASFCETPPPPAVRGRLSRAARLLAGTTLMGASACSTNAVPLYGAPPIPHDAAAERAPDSGAGGNAATDDAAGTGGAPSNDAAEDRSVVALYGGPPVDASRT